MFGLLGLKAKLLSAGAIVVAILAAIGRMKYLKKKAARLEMEADVAKAQLHQEKIQKKVIEDKKIAAQRRRVILMKELEKEGEDFEGVSNLTDANKF